MLQCITNPLRYDSLTLGFFTPGTSCPFSSIILNTGMGFELLGVLASAITLVYGALGAPGKVAGAPFEYLCGISYTRKFILTAGRT